MQRMKERERSRIASVILVWETGDIVITFTEMENIVDEPVLWKHNSGKEALRCVLRMKA